MFCNTQYILPVIGILCEIVSADPLKCLFVVGQICQHTFLVKIFAVGGLGVWVGFGIVDADLLPRHIVSNDDDR